MDERGGRGRGMRMMIGGARIWMGRVMEVIGR